MTATTANCLRASASQQLHRSGSSRAPAEIIASSIPLPWRGAWGLAPIFDHSCRPPNESCVSRDCATDCDFSLPVRYPSRIQVQRCESKVALALQSFLQSVAASRRTTVITPGLAATAAASGTLLRDSGMSAMNISASGLRQTVQVQHTQGHV